MLVAEHLSLSLPYQPPKAYNSEKYLYPPGPLTLPMSPSSSGAPFTPRKKPPIMGQARELMMGEMVIRIEVMVPKEASFFRGRTWDLALIYWIGVQRCIYTCSICIMCVYIYIYIYVCVCAHKIPRVWCERNDAWLQGAPGRVARCASTRRWLLETQERQRYWYQPGSTTLPTNYATVGVRANQPQDCIFISPWIPLYSPDFKIGGGGTNFATIQFLDCFFLGRFREVGRFKLLIFTDFQLPLLFLSSRLLSF